MNPTVAIRIVQENLTRSVDCAHERNSVHLCPDHRSGKWDTGRWRGSGEDLYGQYMAHGERAP